MADDPNKFARRLFAHLPSRYDRLAEVLSMGQNRRWRRAMVDRIAAGLHPRASPTSALPGSSSGSERQPVLLDVASGTAGVALQLADRLGATVVGVDLSLEMLAQGSRNVDAWEASSVRTGPRRTGSAGTSAAVTGPSGAVTGPSGAVALAAGRAEQLPFPDAAFDGLTFTYLLRYVADIDETMTELARVVRPGAPVASLDFMVPPRLVWRVLWFAYTRLLLPVAGWCAGGREWSAVGRFLGPNISGHYRRYPVDRIVAAWQAAGLVDVGWRTMSLGGGLVMWGRRSGG